MNRSKNTAMIGLDSHRAKYHSKDLYGTELVLERLCFKHQALSMFTDLNTAPQYWI